MWRKEEEERGEGQAADLAHRRRAQPTDDDEPPLQLPLLPSSTLVPSTGVALSSENHHLFPRRDSSNLNLATLTSRETRHPSSVGPSISSR